MKKIACLKFIQNFLLQVNNLKRRKKEMGSKWMFFKDVFNPIDSPFYSRSEQTHAELSLNFLPAPNIDVETSESKLDHDVRPKKVHKI